MKTLVTGGAGFIGSHLVDLLLQEGHDVAIVDNLATGRQANLNSAARFYEEDIANRRFEQVLDLERPEVVFHLGAQMSVKASTDDPRYDAQVNVLGLVNVLLGCVATGVRKVVFASSGATYGNPIYLPIDDRHPQSPESPYGITKMVAEHYLRYFARDHDLAFTALRYGNVYGPRQDHRGEAGVVAIFANQLMAGQVPMIHWDGEQVRDYVYVSDIARANLLAATAGDGQCYCVGTGVGSTVNEIYRLVSSALNVDVLPIRGPRRPGDLRAAYFDSSRARTELGWEPQVSLEVGLTNTVRYYQQELAMTAGAVLAS